MEPEPPRDLLQQVSAGFRDRYGAPPQVLARAPGRVNLIGEHTDYNAGLCLPVALPHATWIAVRPREDDGLRISSTAMSGPWQGSLADLRPGAVPGWAAYVVGVLWALRTTGVEMRGLDVHVGSTVPVGAGLSSSAALTCATASAVLALGDPMTAETDRRALVVAAAVMAETRFVGAPTGGLDQTASVWSGPGTALLLDFQDGSRHPVPWRPEDDRVHTVVVDTGVAHAHAGGGYGRRRAECEQAARLLGVPTLRGLDADDSHHRLPAPLRSRVRHVISENERVRAVSRMAAARDWSGVGATLSESHASLRDDFEVSVPELDLVVDTAVAHGALGARMTGGGFGGSAVMLVPEAALGRVGEALRAAYRGIDRPGPQLLPAPASVGAALLPVPE